ncbi:DUF1376 domain-containing protein [Methylobacterium sp. WL7]|uniref:DUF1376 domain-containing protein n=1 Tax=Methylobacterium sp. WL7 TaxID=2603900 RepID=UPI00164EFDE9|nr:DUF1376 domain-containing protein [Methylobacterium sp. WL7]
MKGEFYKMDFRAWDHGTVDLNLDQEAAYLRLCHAMYGVGGPVPNSARFLMGIFRCGNVKAASLVKHLIEAGKIAVTKDGKLFNHRVSEELADRERVSAARRAAGEKGGLAERSTGVQRSSEGRVPQEWATSEPRVDPECRPSEARVDASKSLNSQDPSEAIAPTSKSRGEERREEQEDASHLPERKRSRASEPAKPNILCPVDFEPTERHAAKAAERGYDRAFVVKVRDRMFRWSHSNAKRPTAKKTDWNLALFDFLEKAMDEADERGGRGGQLAKPRSAQESFLNQSRNADREMRGEDDQSPFLFDAEPVASAAGYSNGHARPALLEPPGGNRGFPPPRYPGPARTH